MEEASLKLAERVGQVSQAAKAAHSRLDNLEDLMRVSLKEMTDELKKLSITLAENAYHKSEIEKLRLECQTLRDDMNQKKGGKASLIYALSTLIASVSAAAAVAKLFFH